MKETYLLTIFLILIGNLSVNAQWRNIVRDDFGSGWEGINLNYSWNAGGGWKWLPEAGLWIYVFDHNDTDSPENSNDSMVKVSGGTLYMSMGSVTVDGFYIGSTEVTWGEWQNVRQWASTNGYDLAFIGDGCAVDHPVHSVNWYDVVKWCNAKSEQEGLAPVYKIELNGSVYRYGQRDDIVRDYSADGYRLPMEVEWEFAARGGNNSKGYSYAGSNDLSIVGWYTSNSSGSVCNLGFGRGTWPVAQKAANELGIYDMSGNIHEWCFDWFPNKKGYERLLRGGSWLSSAGTCSVVRQWGEYPSVRGDYDYGFRLVRSVFETTIVPMVSVPFGVLQTTTETTVMSNFFIGTTEVTWSQWKDLRTWASANGYDLENVGAGCSPEHPVHTVNWYDVVKWCNAASEKEGLTPVYTAEGQVYRFGQRDDVAMDSSANGYRLPTEKEWRFAAGGANQFNGETYAGSNDLDAVGWYTSNSNGADCDMSKGRGTWPVGLKAANVLGTYDMSGNVWEWCYNRGSGNESSNRLLHGGSFVDLADKCSIFTVLNFPPEDRYPIFGFRVAKSPGN